MRGAILGEYMSSLRFIETCPDRGVVLVKGYLLLSFFEGKPKKNQREDTL